LKKLWLIPLVLVLLALIAVPAAIRWFYFYEGRWQPRTIPRPDLSAVEVPAPALTTYTDRAEAAPPGTILLDRIHDNNFKISDLAVLQSRLAARGQRLEPVESEDSFSAQLRYAKALIVISPRVDWTVEQIQMANDFVGRGGRLLLISDATHFDAITDDFGNLVGLDYDATHLNGLAGTFGLVFQSDYLYNTVENENNYRNIKLSEFAAGPLTQGLKGLVFFATRSITSDTPGLVLASGETRSNANPRLEQPAVAMLAAEDRVLALGDLTFLSEPYNGIADNDQFTSNIADFLSGSEREYTLADLPYFFGDAVDLVYASDPLLDSDLLPGGSSLQALFAGAGKTLSIQASENQAHDTLFLGLYEKASEVDAYLADAGVTLVLSPTQALDVDAGIELSPIVTTTEEFTSRIEIGSVGPMVITGTSLIVLESQGSRRVLVVLSDTVTGLEDTIRRLVDGDLAGCVLREADAPGRTGLALCSSGELDKGEGAGGWPKPKEEDQTGLFP
jgi:hypothetical protein